MCLRGDPRPQRVYVVLSNAHTLVHGKKPRSAVNTSCAVYGEAPCTPFFPLGAGHLTAGVNPAKSASPSSWWVVAAVGRVRASMTTCAQGCRSRTADIVCNTVISMACDSLRRSVDGHHKATDGDQGPRGRTMQWGAACIVESKTEQQREHIESTGTAVRRDVARINNSIAEGATGAARGQPGRPPCRHHKVPG